MTDVLALPVVALPKSSGGGVVESHSSQSARRMGHPLFVVVSAYSRFLTALSALFGMTKFIMGLWHD
jgi:hypothetical protein